MSIITLGAVYSTVVECPARGPSFAADAIRLATCNESVAVMSSTFFI